MSFFVRNGNDFSATEYARGPWHVDFLHAGPPAALLVHELEAACPDLQMVRFGTDLLKPVPLATLRVEVHEQVPGRRRRILEANLYAAESGQHVARATALFLRTEAMPLGALPVHDGEAPPPPEAAEPTTFPFFKHDVGYHTGMEQRLAGGGFGTGRSRMWMRQRVPLLPDEEPSPLQRLMTVADSGNGVSMVLDWRRFTFANPDLTVNIRRPPRGEWLCLDATTHCQPDGLGIAESRIWDADGVFANATQNLLLESL